MIFGRENLTTLEKGGFAVGGTLYFVGTLLSAQSMLETGDWGGMLNFYMFGLGGLILASTFARVYVPYSEADD